MTTDTTVSAFRHPDAIEDPLTSVLRDGARRLLAEAIEAEAEVFLAAIADSDDVARSFRFHVAHHSGMMSPGFPSAADV